jgi:hypothetical protein
VGKDASIDFLCLPSFDSPSVFAALLDADLGGRFQIAPQLDDAVHRQLYLPDTNVLLTLFLSDDGVADVSDFMPVEDAGAPGSPAAPTRTAGAFSRYSSRDDFQRRDLFPFEFKEEPQVHWAAGKLSGKPTGYDRLAVPLLGCERLACVVVLGRSIGLPLLDGGAAAVRMTLVRDDPILRETPSNGLAIPLVRSKVRGDRPR